MEPPCQRWVSEQTPKPVLSAVDFDIVSDALEINFHAVTGAVEKFNYLMTAMMIAGGRCCSENKKEFDPVE